MPRKARIEFIDLAKCIAIIMVVWGHTATNAELQSESVAMTYRIMYSIHMPLFFFLTGLSVSVKPFGSREEWGFFLKKNILTIAFPYLIWALIYCSFSFENVGRILYGSWKCLTNAATLTSLWYLSCLFIARIIVQLFVTLVGNRTKWNLKVASAVAGALLITAGALLPDLENGYPWCFNIALVASGCILFGIALKNALIRLSIQKIWVLTALLAASVGAYMLIMYLRGNGFRIMMMCKSSYGGGPEVILSAATGGFAVLLASMILRQLSEEYLPDGFIKPLLYIGKYTLGVFILHKPIMQSLFIPMLEGWFGECMPLMVIRMIGAVIAFIFSLVMCNIISYYVPELVGVFGKDKIMGKASVLKEE